MPTDIYQLVASVHWDKRGRHRANLVVNGEVVAHATTDDDAAGMSALATIDPDKDIVEVVAYGASEIKGPYASTIGKPVELTGTPVPEDPLTREAAPPRPSRTRDCNFQP